MSQVAAYAHKAGFGIAGAIDGHGHKLSDSQRLRELATSIAIAFAESKGDPHAKGVNRDKAGNVKSIDVGLWQINSGNFSYVGTDEVHLYDPQSNAIAANAIFARRNNTWGDWTTYNRGYYLPYMPAAMAAAKVEIGVNVGKGKGTADIPGSASSGGDAVTAVTGLLGAPLKVADFLGKLANPVTWIRVAEVMFGGIFILAGLAILAKELGAGRATIGAVKMAAPIVKAVK